MAQKAQNTQNEWDGLESIALLKWPLFSWFYVCICQLCFMTNIKVTNMKHSREICYSQEDPERPRMAELMRGIRYLKPCTCRLTEWEWSKSDRLSWLGCLIFLQTATASPLWMDDPRPQCTSRSFYSTGCLYFCLEFYLYSTGCFFTGSALKVLSASR